MTTFARLLPVPPLAPRSSAGRRLAAAFAVAFTVALAGPSAVAEEAPQGEFVVSLVNGDRLTGTIIGLDATTLRFAPDATTDAGLDLPLARIEAIDRTGVVEPVEPRGDRLYPAAGGVIHGELTSLDTRGVGLDAHLVGPLTLPFGAVEAFVRQGVEQPQRAVAGRLHEIHEAAGNRLVGDVQFAPGGLTVTADGFNATVATRLVNAILFPVAEPRPEDATAPPTSCTLELLNGSEIVGVAPRLDGGRIVVGVAPERTAAVPVDHVARLAFGSASGPAGGRRRVAFWAQFADTDEEVPNMAAALREGLPAGWTVESDGVEAADLAEALKTAGVLVVPEIETFDADTGPQADEFGATLTAFLQRGGTVVIAGVDEDMFGFWRATGLVSLSGASRLDEGCDCSFVRGSPLGRGVGASFPAVNATFSYETDDDALRPSITAAEGGSVSLVKKVGRGAIVLVGMDYFARSPEIDRVLVNAVTQGRGR